MAAPTIAGSAATTEVTSNTTSHALNIPASVASGELLLGFLAVDTSPTHTWPAGWTKLGQIDNGANCSISVGKRTADGTEGGGTVTVTTSTSQMSSAVIVRIDGADHANVELSTGATAFNNSPDPDSHTPSGGSDDYLYAAFFGVDRNRSTSGFPSNMTTGPEASVAHSDTNGASCGLDFHATSASTSFDPNTFSISASEGWSAATVSVPPASGHTGTAAVTAPAFEIAAVGEQPHEGTGDLTAPAIEIAATAEQPHEGTADLTAPAIEIAGSATQEMSGSGDLTAPAFELAASAAEEFTATADLTAPAIEIASIGEQPHEGVGAITAPAFVISATGTHGDGTPGEAGSQRRMIANVGTMMGTR